MKRVVVDASALAAMIFQENEGERVRDALTDAVVFAPAILKFELASVALKKIRQQPTRATDILRALAAALDPRSNLSWQDVQPVDVVLVANATGLSVYDASYLWLAGALGADLVTLDGRLDAVSERL